MLIAMATLAIVLSAALPCGDRAMAVEDSRHLSDQGRLEFARAEVDRQLSDESQTACERIWLHLQNARILDRIGLHTQTRPVLGALAEINAAARLASAFAPDTLVHAEIEYERGYYYYRLEMADRTFDRAQQAVDRAIHLAEAHGPSSLLADAVHLAGLIQLFRRQVDTARELFDRSLEIDQAAGARLFFVGEYHRHVALAHVFEDNWEQALPHYQRSHQARIENGQLDASLFSALSYGDALRRTNATDRAVDLYRQALDTARRINSPFGIAQSAIRLGELQALSGNTEAAIQLYRTASEAAALIGREDLVRRTESAIEQLLP